jgi:hypothetical protein
MDKQEKLTLTTPGWEAATTLLLKMLEKNLTIEDVSDDDKFLMLIYITILMKIFDKILGRTKQ